MKRVAILYIATGRYTIFWDEFYTSSQQLFLADDDSMRSFSKEYFVFSDAETIDHCDEENVHLIYQEALRWPFITLDRFSIFQKARKELENYDFIYFFNSNMKFITPVSEEILPTENRPLVMVKHPCFFDKEREQFTYETSPSSMACINDNEGEHYVMGGLNGGTAPAYLALVDELEYRVEKDKESSVIALWHDESHLNRYCIDKSKKVKILDASYGAPEGWNLPIEPKIIIRNKDNYGGHVFLRRSGGIKNFLKEVFGL